MTAHNPVSDAPAMRGAPIGFAEFVALVAALMSLTALGIDSMWSLGLYAVANVACALAGSFALLLVARVAGGAVIAAARVATIALVRDCYHGRAMAQVMSIAFMVFMIVPILAPTFGWTVLQFGDWRAIFGVIAVLTLLVMAWFWIRMPETLAPENVLPITPARILSDWRVTLSDRLSLGYTLAATALMG